MKLIERPKYINKIRPYYRKQLIKTITGQRRSGKTFLLYLIEKDLLQKYPQANIIFIDKEKIEFDNIIDYRQLYDFVGSRLKPEYNFVFINEVQRIKEFEKALLDMQTNPEIDIYITGSNAQLLSSEFATLLSGRQLSIHLLPLSFPEFLRFNNLDATEQSLFLYMKYGGLPYLIHLSKDDEVIYDYLQNVVDTIIYRDILSRFNVRESFILTDILKFLATSVTGLVSAKRVVNFLKSQGINKSLTSIIEILDYLDSAFIVSRARRFDVRGGKVFEKKYKFYFEDAGIRNALAGLRQTDFGKVAENLVYNHLRYLGYTVYVGQLYDTEIDFVAERKGERKYIQVAYRLSDDKTVKREFGNLLNIKDNYPKYVISNDVFSAPNTYKGIKHLTLLDFLTLEEF